MFDGASDQVSRGVAGQAEEGEVVRFGGDAGKDDFVGMSTQQGGGAFARVLQCAARTAADLVRTGRVAVDAGEVGPHRLPHGRVRGCGGVVVEIDAIHEGPTRPKAGRGTMVSPAPWRRSGIGERWAKALLSPSRPLALPSAIYSSYFLPNLRATTK